MADVMLGRLARWLRAFGYDTLYFREASDPRLLGIALREGRRLLTRDAGLAGRTRGAGLLVRTEDLDEQIREVMTACGIGARSGRRRCLECNGEVVPCSPGEARDRVPPYTLATQREFHACTGCARVFWRGSHAPGILRRLRAHLGPTPGELGGRGGD